LKKIILKITKNYLIGHLADDGRYYLIDFSRVMPPEYPTESEDIFFKLLRPEFVSGYHVPLSSDSFSGFSGRDSTNNNLQTRIATENLYKVIEIFSREFSEMVDKEIEENWHNIANFHHKLPRIIHQAGINMRHLGILYNNRYNFFFFYIFFYFAFYV
jgi:hypothetical protein